MPDLGERSEAGENSLNLWLLPFNPVIFSGLRAINAAGPHANWQVDLHGRPIIKFSNDRGRVWMRNHLPWEHPLPGLPRFTRRFMKTRWSQIHASRLREAVRELSAETADVFIIILARMAALGSTGACISIDEIAEYRGIRRRHGSWRSLQTDLADEVCRLSRLQLSIAWRGYPGSERERTFNPVFKPLLQITGCQAAGDGQPSVFELEAGPALCHFLNKGADSSTWTRVFSSNLLALNPYKYGLAKKLGTFWLMGGPGSDPPTPRMLLDYCGEKINWRNPGHTVDTLIESHNRLQDLGIIEEAPVIEPFDRRRGYFLNWLDSPLDVRLSSPIRNSLAGKTGVPHQLGPLDSGNDQTISLPTTFRQLQRKPRSIRQGRGLLGEQQGELARALGVTRQTLSRYERGLSPLPEATARRIIKIWKSAGLV